MQLESNERELINNQVLRIENYGGYDFSENAGSAIYSVCDYFEVQGYDDDGKWILRQNDNPQYFISKVLINEGLVPLTFDIVNQWGADDQIIFEYVANSLGLQLL